MLYYLRCEVGRSLKCPSRLYQVCIELVLEGLITGDRLKNDVSYNAPCFVLVPAIIHRASHPVRLGNIFRCLRQVAAQDLQVSMPHHVNPRVKMCQ